MAGTNGFEDENVVRRPWSIRKRVFVAAVSIVLVTVVIAAALYLPISPFRERSVSYEFSVVIEAEASEQFVVVCPLPADHDGTVCPDAISSMVVSGDATITEVTTPYGEGLRVVGTGHVSMTWVHNSTYRTSTQDIYDHYSNLSMLDIGYSPGNAFVEFEGGSAEFSLRYVYEHWYSTRIMSADLLVYRATGNLTPGLNAIPVDFEHLKPC